MKELDKVHAKLDVIDEKLSGIVITQTEQAADLKHHIFRTDLAEQHLKHLESKIEPLTELHSKFNGVMKFVGVIATGVTVSAGVIKLVEFIFQ